MQNMNSPNHHHHGRPGIVLVRSRITSPSLALSTFHKWYDQIHIPDLLISTEGGVTSAARYEISTSSRSSVSKNSEALPTPSGDTTTTTTCKQNNSGPDESSSPSSSRSPPAMESQHSSSSSGSSSSSSSYLAIYTLPNLSWLGEPSCPFWKQRLNSSILPNDRDTIFKWAEFETEFWEDVTPPPPPPGAVDTTNNHETKNRGGDNNNQIGFGDDVGVSSGDGSPGEKKIVVGAAPSRPGRLLLAVRWERAAPRHCEDYAKIIMQTLKRNLVVGDFGTIGGDPSLRLFVADENLGPPGKAKGPGENRGRLSPPPTKYLCLVEFENLKGEDQDAKFPEEEIDLMPNRGTTEYRLIGRYGGDQ